MTSPASRKAAELRANPAATVAYQAADGTGYVSVQGVASVVTDVEARVADFARGITPPPDGLKSAAIVRDGAGWRLRPYPGM